MDNVLICEISGKRPGTMDNRPTEKFRITLPHVIISNNSEGYDTDWPIINVPDEYREWYINNVKMNDNAWMAPMNRSYALKYAREHGYRYCIQLDDNITHVGIDTRETLISEENMVITKEYRNNSHIGDGLSWIDDFSIMLVRILKNSNAGMAGMNINSAGVPSADYLNERYSYSFFAIDTERAPSVFQGGFEDDIEYRLKLAQMGIPSIQCCPLSYGKTGQISGKDSSGCRKEYDRIGVNRGREMKKLYGDIYSCGMIIGSHAIKGKKRKIFKHKLKRFKIGALIKRKHEIDEAMNGLFSKYAETQPTKIKIYQNEKLVYTKGG